MPNPPPAAAAATAPIAVAVTVTVAVAVTFGFAFSWISATIGMSVGLALLTSIGQNRIDELSALITESIGATRRLALT